MASKATGFPIAKIAAKLAVGYTLDEIPNDITRKTPASFEPTIDYVVTKVPRWAFEKFPTSPGVLGTSMQSVGEAMAIGRTFPESLQKALRSLEVGPGGLELRSGRGGLRHPGRRRAGRPGGDRHAGPPVPARGGAAPGDHDRDAGRADQGRPLVPRPDPAHRRGAGALAASGPDGLSPRDWKRAKRLGFADAQLAWLWGVDVADVRRRRLAAGVRPTYKTVDTCGAEFEAATPYHYSTYEDEDETVASGRRKVLILGSGPNRIGQGIEFDYCCVHASFALAEAGYETVMLNCNPETVSTDYDTSDRLYFEPLTLEDTLNVIDAERAAGELVGVVVSFGRADAPQAGIGAAGGPRPRGPRRRRSMPPRIASAGTPCAPASGSPSPPAARPQRRRGASRRRSVGYPALLRPSYVLGGRAMEIVYDEDGLRRAMAELASFGSLGREGGLSASRPVLIDRFLEDATEVDVDAIRDPAGDVVISADGTRRGGGGALG